MSERHMPVTRAGATRRAVRRVSDCLPLLRRHAAAVIASVLTAAALVVAVPSGPASARPVEGSFAVSLSGAYGDATYTEQNATADITQSNQGTQQVVSVSVAPASGDGLSFDFQSRDNSNQYLDVGYYGNAQRYPFTDPGRPGISISPLGFCNEQTGDFEVRDIRHDGLAITGVWITFQRYCDGKDPVFGEIRVGYPADSTEVAPRAVRWPQGNTYPGHNSYDVPVLVRPTSTSPDEVTAVSVVGPHAADYPIRHNDCAGTLPTTGCTVTVGFTPGGPGPRHAQLKVSTTQGDRYVSLDGAGALGSTAWVLDVDHDEPTETDEHFDMPSAAAVGSPYSIHTQGFQSDGTIWDLMLSLPTGQTFAPGHYAYNPDGTGLRISLGRGNNGCEVDRADVDIDAIAFSGPDDDMSLLDMGFDVHCRSASGNTTSGRVTFHARDDVTAPAAPTALTGHRKGTDVSLTWQKPGDPDLAGVLVRWYPGTTAPTATDAGEFAYLGTGKSARIPAPSDGPVTVSVWAYDTSGNVGTPSTVTVQ